MKSHLAFAAAVLLAVLAGCERQAHTDRTLLSREQALEIAERTIKDRGLDRDDYSLSTFGNELSEDGGEWLFNYELKPVPCPGCFFFIVVDRASGSVAFIPGE